MNPQRIMAYPYEVWIAKQGTEFPPLTDVSSAIEGKSYNRVAVGGVASGTETWFKIGTSGNRDYSDAGVTVTHMQTISTFQGAGSTWVRKAWRSDEGMQVSFDLADVSPTQYAMIMDEASLTVTTSGMGAGSGEEFSLNRGLQVKGQAMFLRGISSITEGKASQYEIPFCYQAANPAPKYAIKGGPALLSLQYTAIEGELSTPAAPNAGLPKLRVQK